MANVTVTKNSYTTDSLYQWDLNQELKIYGLSVPITPEIHFAHESMKEAIVRTATMDSAGVISVKIPNSLLEKPNKINAYVCVTNNGTFQSLYKIVIPVIGRAKPGDYEMTDPEGEIYSIDALAVESVTLATGSEATVKKTVENGVVKLTFGLPRGLKGDKGDKGDPVGTFYVNLTYNEDGTYTSDKKVAEMEAAYQAGHILYCVLPYGGDKMILPLTCRTEAIIWTFEGAVFGEILRVQFFADIAIDFTKVEVGGSGGTNDWNELNNRPFYSETGETVLPETTVEFDPDAGERMIADVIPVAVGNPYKVYWNGTEYFCVAGIVDMEGLPLFVLGDFSVMTGVESTGEPFVIAVLPAEVAAEMGAGATVLALDGSTSATVSIKEAIVHTLNPVYLPKLDVKFTARYDYGGTFYGDADKSLDEIRSAIARGVPVTGIVESTSEGVSFSYRLVVNQVSPMSVSFYYHNPIVNAYIVADYYADGMGDTFSGGFPVKFYRSKVIMDIVEVN